VTAREAKGSRSKVRSERRRSNDVDQEKSFICNENERELLFSWAFDAGSNTREMVDGTVDFGKPSMPLGDAVSRHTQWQDLKGPSKPSEGGLARPARV
jgi:hypothetical protein